MRYINVDILDALAKPCPVCDGKPYIDRAANGTYGYRHMCNGDIRYCAIPIYCEQGQFKDPIDVLRSWNNMIEWCNSAQPKIRKEVSEVDLEDYV